MTRNVRKQICCELLFNCEISTLKMGEIHLMCNQFACMTCKIGHLDCFIPDYLAVACERYVGERRETF
jgi:hypothetical protein